MKNLVLLVFAASLAATSATAQGTGKPAARPAVSIPTAPPAAASVPAANPAANAPSPAAPAQAIPAAAPPPPTLPPATVVPTRPAPPPMPVAITADAPGGVSTTADGTRITFGAGRADMTQASADTIRALARAGRTLTTTYTITALAAGTAEDPSAARRVSLSRGLALRSLLITEGIPSTRIYVHALGNTPESIGHDPADRADIVVKPQSAVKPTP